MAKKLNQKADKGIPSPKFRTQNLLILKVWPHFKIKDNDENIETIQVYTL